MTHLHHKWCVYSILPLAPRAKQPALHNYTFDTPYTEAATDKLSQQYEHTACRAVELVRFQLAAGGCERSEPNMLLWLLFSFMLGFRGGWGKHCVIWTCQKLLSCYGTLRERTMPTAHWLLYKAVRLKLARMSGRGTDWIQVTRTENFGYFNVLLNIFTFLSFAFAERANNFVHKWNQLMK
jgi:hypothetical protein